MADSKYKLTYFNTKGLSEYIRFAFAYADVPFEDRRIAKADWPQLKEKQQFGKLPVLEVEGKEINQSVAILRFLGKRFGLVVDDPMTEALLEALVDNIKDLVEKLKASFHERTTESVEEVKKIKADLFGKMEPLLEKGYFYGSKITWVDIYFAGLVEMIVDYAADFLEGYPKLQAHVDKIKSNSGIQKYIKNRPEPELMRPPTECPKAKK